MSAGNGIRWQLAWRRNSKEKLLWHHAGAALIGGTSAPASWLRACLSSSWLSASRAAHTSAHLLLRPGLTSLVAAGCRLVHAVSFSAVAR